MSVQPGPTFKRYAANGLVPTFAIPFLLLDPADLQITLNGVLVTSGFTLTGIGDPISSCTFTVNPTGDLLFQQVMPFQRLADYQINGDFLAQTVNRDLDRLWLAVKQLSRDSGRALTVSLLEPEGIPPLPSKATRALKMLAFDVDGIPTPSNLTLEQIEQQPALALESAAAAQASAEAAADAQDAAALSADASSASATLSSQWAENPEDVAVTPGLFSAHHWANKAAALVASIAALYTRMTAVELRATNLEYGYVSPNQTWAASGTLTLTHGLGAMPKRTSIEAECIVADAGYSIGGVVDLGPSQCFPSGAVFYGFSTETTATQLIVSIAINGLVVINKSTKNPTTMTPSSWRLRVKASKS